MGDWLGSGGTTSSLVLDCEGFAGFAGLFNLVTRARLGLAVTSDADLQSCSFYWCWSLRSV